MTTGTTRRRQKLPPGPWQCDRVASKKTMKRVVESRIPRTFLFLSRAFVDTGKKVDFGDIKIPCSLLH